MTVPTIDEVYFDEADGNLFMVPEPRLRADALRHSVLPRLQALMHHCISLIRDVYQVEVLDDSILFQSPSFRTRRDRELEHLYEGAKIGLGGQRSRTKWVGAHRRDGKQAVILPFVYGVQADIDGLCIHFDSQWLTGIGPDFHERVFGFHIAYESEVACLARLAVLRDAHAWLPEGPVADWATTIEALFSSGLYRLDFGSEALHYPIPTGRLRFFCERFMVFFPIYDTYLRFAMDQSHRFEELIAALNQWFLRLDQATTEQGPGQLDEQQITRARQAAAARTEVMPSVRWQVFQRDGFRCHRCGRGAADGVILHLDHRTPRAQGGSDHLSNLVTKCSECNLGKGARLEIDGLVDEAMLPALARIRSETPPHGQEDPDAEQGTLPFD